MKKEKTDAFTQAAESSAFCFNLCWIINILQINSIKKQNTFSTGFEATEQSSLTWNDNCYGGF
jgi:hypothetical protein